VTLVLVDGYNLIRRIPELRAVESRSGLEAGRRALDNRLAGYVAGRGGVRVTVVYDGEPGAAKSCSRGMPTQPW